MRRILVVDDEKEIRDFLMKVILKNGGYIVETVSSVREAVKKFSENNYNILITDINMPEISGFCLIGYVKKKFHDCKVIAMSAEGAQLEAAEKTGASFCLTKPFMISEIMEKIISPAVPDTGRDEKIESK